MDLNNLDLDPQEQMIYRQADYYKAQSIAYYANQIFLPYPIHPEYLVGNMGSVYSTRKKRYVKPCIDQDGYLRVHVGEARGVHRVVLMTFNPVPNMNELQVNHINGVKWMNCFFGVNDPRTNIEWCTVQENIQHACEHGLRHGDLENHFNAIYTNEFIHAVCRNMKAGYTGKQNAYLLGIPWTPQFQDLTTKIRLGVSWRKIAEQYGLVKGQQQNDD